MPKPNKHIDKKKKENSKANFKKKRSTLFLKMELRRWCSVKESA